MNKDKEMEENIFIDIYLYLAGLWVACALFIGFVELVTDYSESKLIMWIALFNMCNIWAYSQKEKINKETKD